MNRVLNLPRGQVLNRAISQIIITPAPPPGAPADAGHRPIHYRLDDSGLLGGDDPSSLHCADWSYGKRTPTADCIGFALWASGIARNQPDYSGSRGTWLNCASLLDDADGAKKFCRPLFANEQARHADWLLTRDHIAVIIRPAQRPDQDHLVVDCSPRHGRTTAIDTGGPWSGECRVIRPLFYTDV